MNDPIADMLTRVRNAARAGKEKVDVPYSRIKLEIARILTEEGFLRNYKTVEVKGRPWWIRLSLKYGERKEPVIHGIRRVSRPGLRAYRGRRSVQRVRGGTGVAILSTSKGILSDRQAREQGVGGEVLCEVH